MLIIGIFIALAFFFYFQQKASARNMDRFQKSRERFEDLLDDLRKKDKGDAAGKKEDNNNQEKI